MKINLNRETTANGYKYQGSIGDIKFQLKSNKSYNGLTRDLVKSYKLLTTDIESIKLKWFMLLTDWNTLDEEPTDSYETSNTVFYFNNPITGTDDRIEYDEYGGYFHSHTANCATSVKEVEESNRIL